MSAARGGQGFTEKSSTTNGVTRTETRMDNHTVVEYRKESGQLLVEYHVRHSEAGKV